MILVSPFRFVFVSFSVWSFFSYLIWMSWIFRTSSCSTCFMISLKSQICCCASSWHCTNESLCENSQVLCGVPVLCTSLSAPPDQPEPAAESSPAVGLHRAASAPSGLGLCSLLQPLTASHSLLAFFHIFAEDLGTFRALPSASGCRTALCMIDW